MNKILNSDIAPSPFLFKSTFDSELKRKDIFSNLFEQLLLFDNIVLSTDKDNHTLYFLIRYFGYENTLRLIKSGYISFYIRTSIIVHSKGKRLDDGTIDESTIYSQPPIVGGSLHGDDIDIEENIYRAIKPFRFDKKRERELIKNTHKQYIKDLDLELGTNTSKIITDAYINNNLENLGMPFTKDPYELNVKEREDLFQIGHSVLESSILLKHNLKSFNNTEHLKILSKNFENIGKAYNVTENTNKIFEIENMPDLKSAYLNGQFNLDDIFKLRHLSNAKYFRKWINDISETTNANEITVEYLNEVEGSKKFFQTSLGKFIKTTASFGVGSGLGMLIGGPAVGLIGAGAAKIAEPVTDYAFGLLETYALDNLIEGKNPRGYLNKVKEEINKNSV
ncbi:MAG: hypothetical protein KDD29_09890 [Flavobacteriales bacterium]|nr:hypothetical protein [Flavobacteriales bacterium]